MSAAASEHDRFLMLCTSCQRPVRVPRGWVGREVCCPYCGAALRVPEPGDGASVVRAGMPRVGPRRVFYFPCPRCESMLEAHTGLCGGTGRCPGCGSRLRIPLVDRKGRPKAAEILETPAEQASAEDEATLAPVHAYAADGSAAPRIVEVAGEQRIACPRCEAVSPIDADACASCGLPFTMDAAGTAGRLRRTRYASLAWLMGAASVILFPVVLPAVIALFCGVRAMLEPGRSGVASAWVGIGLACLSLVGAMVFWWQRLA